MNSSNPSPGDQQPQEAQQQSVSTSQTANEGFSLPPVTLGYRHTFGSKPNVRGGIHFTEASTVCYPCGRLMVLHKLEAKTQKFLQGADEGIETVCTALSQSRR